MRIVPMFFERTVSAGCGNEAAYMETPLFIILIVVAVVWTAFWKGLSLWHAAQRKNSAWFIVLLLFNTLGFLDILYLFKVAKIKSDKLFK